MSEFKLISPLLDGFSVGNPISEHNGVHCCPAIKENTDKKYIVKIISVPASQVQMDAMLLAGAYKDPAEAMEYFRQVGEDILKEAELLKKLSKLEGFLPYEGWQMEPITRRRLGYQIYLVGSYKRSLDKHVKQHPVTHLEAINLGLDLCSALSVCRQAGALYVDLKPSNIFVSDKKEYRIGDLGFVEMDALSYMALPDKYYSPYTPPELYDPMASLNLTVDTYALGMILYQLYNDGQLPFKGTRTAETTIPSPVNADYELAEIIMKAIHSDPAERWTDPKEMGKALASYMQKNAVNDIPITPHTPLDVKPEDIVAIPKKKKAAVKKEADEQPAEISAILEEEQPVETETAEEPASEDPAVEAAVFEEPSAELEEPKQEETLSSEPTVISDAEDSEELQFDELDDDLSRMIAQADDLISHETPEGIVIPEVTDPFAFVMEDSDEIDDSDIPVDPDMEDEADEKPKKKKKKKEKKYADPKYKRRTKRFVSVVLFLLVVCGFGLGAFWYYQNIYLQPVNAITIDGGQEEITVMIDSGADESLLRVTCKDSYGKSETHAVTGGKAVFTDLQPNTLYTIHLEINGFHKLVGKTSDVYTTDATTSIVTFTSVAGAEDGSVLLNFTVDGEEPNDWTVVYSTEDGEEKQKTFKGHSVTITNLTVGEVYTFRLEPGENISLSGQTTLALMASRLIQAEDLAISSANGTDITVSWKAPGDVIVDSWDVRCYNDLGYEEQITVSDTQVMFPGIDPTSSYTVEVTASGMTQPARTSITANPINISAIDVDASSHKKLTVNWQYTGNDPEDGWLLTYSFVGGQKNVVKCKKASAEIPLNIPDAKYDITIQAADGTTVFNNISTYASPKAVVFDKHSLNAYKLAVNLLKTPEEDDWNYENISDDQFTDTFAPGDKISVVMRYAESFYLTGEKVDVMYVIRDSYGNILPDLVSEETFPWKDIWTGGDSKNGELNIPAVPTAAGEYVLNIYFDGMSVAELPFTISE